MLTVPLTAKGGLKANLVVDEGGHARFRLLQNGNPVEGYAKDMAKCDDVAMPVFDQLPDGEFQVEIDLKNARLYTLQF